jgi:hypothetical protein
LNREAAGRESRIGVLDEGDVTIRSASIRLVLVSLKVAGERISRGTALKNP